MCRPWSKHNKYRILHEKKVNTFSFFLVTRRNKEKFFFSFFFQGMSLYNTILRAKMSLNLCTSFKLHSILHFLFHYLCTYPSSFLGVIIPMNTSPVSGQTTCHIWIFILNFLYIYLWLVDCVYITIVHVYKYIIQA